MSDNDGGSGGGGGGGGGGGERGDASRRHRMRRWTLREIIVLIEGKRAVEGVGRGARGPGAAVVAETKWATISSYCRKNGVDRGPMQCRKRWDNLTADFKKIRGWERGEGATSGESFWAMRSDRRRDRRLPGLFDNEIYRMLDGTADVEVLVEGGDDCERAEGNDREEDKEGQNEEEAGVQTAAENGLFSDLNHANGIDDVPIAIVPLSARKMDSSQQEFSDPGYAGNFKDKQKDNGYEKQSTPQGRKRARTSPDEVENDYFQKQLIDVLERSNKMIVEQLKAQNSYFQLDRDQCREQANSLIDVLNKVADAVGRIADKL